MGVDLQGIVVGCKLERQGRVTLLLKAPVGIQHLEKTQENIYTLDVGSNFYLCWNIFRGVLTSV